MIRLNIFLDWSKKYTAKIRKSICDFNVRLVCMVAHVVYVWCVYIACLWVFFRERGTEKLDDEWTNWCPSFGSSTSPRKNKYIYMFFTVYRRNGFFFFVIIFLAGVAFRFVWDLVLTKNLMKKQPDCYTTISKVCVCTRAREYMFPYVRTCLCVGS